MIRLSRGLGVPDGDVKFSPNKVTSAQACADKGGTLYDNNAFCCIEVDPATGAKTPGSGSFVCAPTAFAPAQQQASTAFVPQQVRQIASQFPWEIMAGVAAVGLTLFVLTRKK